MDKKGSEGQHSSSERDVHFMSPRPESPKEILKEGQKVDEGHGESHQKDKSVSGNQRNWIKLRSETYGADPRLLLCSD